MPSVKLDSIEGQFELNSGSPLIDLELEYFGVHVIPFGCRAGACGACLVEVQEGIDNLGVQTIEEANFIRRLGRDPENHRLACQCRVTGDVLLKRTPRLRRPIKIVDRKPA
jgi:ferredoxin